MMIFRFDENANLSDEEILPGQKYRLRSGNIVSVIRKTTRGWDCGYVRGLELLPPGEGNTNRLILTAEFLHNWTELVE